MFRGDVDCIEHAFHVRREAHPSQTETKENAYKPVGYVSSLEHGIVEARSLVRCRAIKNKTHFVRLVGRPEICSGNLLDPVCLDHRLEQVRRDRRLSISA